MATTKKTEETAESTEKVEIDYEELVPYMASISRENKSDIFVSLNGRNLQIQRGKRVMIPRWAKEILDQSEEMDALAMERSQDLQNEQ